ncbi:UNVERIFIED_ORG: exopolyphosphatase [Clostridium botulinum]
MSNQVKVLLSVIDLGNYNVKGINQDKKSIKLKSNISRKYESYPEAFKYIKINGEYTYFEKGSFSLEYVKTNKDYTSQLLYAISKLHEEINEIDTNLTLLLPIGEMKYKNKYIEELKGKSYNVEVRTSKKLNKKINIKDILVVPEGYTSYFTLKNEEKVGSVLLIDIGGRTTNIVAMVNGEPQVLTTCKIGILDFYSKIQELNSEKEYKLEDIERLIKEGKIQITEKQLIEFMNDVLNEIKLNVNLAHYEKVKWTGGGSEVLKDIIENHLPKNCTLIKNPLTSNVEGALEVSKITWGLSNGKEEKK